MSQHSPNDYGGPDPVGTLYARVQQWAGQNPVKAEGGAVCAALGGACLAFPGPLWSLATAYPFRFGCIMTAGMLAWCIRFEAREQRLQRWLLRPGHAFRWVLEGLRWVDLDTVEPNGRWEWTDGSQPKPKTATKALDEAMSTPTAPPAHREEV
jgi:hypothetical protein